MAPKFGNYLFRNLKAEPGSQRAAASPSDQGPVEDQEITLRPGDFTSEIGSALNWGSREPREIRVKLKQTDGLMEGRVSISGKVLRELYPGLVPDPLKEDTVFPLSLRSVVLQLQNVMRAVGDGSNLAGAPDFDTPIAQVAREDEGFFKLEEHAPQTASKQAVPASSDEFGSVLPLIREKVQDREDLSRQSKAAGETPSIQPVQVVAPFPSQPSQPPKSIDPLRTDPFAELPKPKLGMPQSATAGPKLSEQESLRPTETQTELPKPQRRRGLEQLQELFLTDDFLDAGQVAQLLRAFPKVKAALIMLDDGTVLGGALPENYKSGAAASAPALMRAVREFGTAISSAEVSAFTLFADSPISVFLEGRICMLVVHEGRGLLPGMRLRFTEIAKALDALCDSGDKTS
jgi:hypothetical protein